MIKLFFGLKDGKFKVSIMQEEGRALIELTTIAGRTEANLIESITYKTSDLRKIEIDEKTFYQDGIYFSQSDSIPKKCEEMCQDILKRVKGKLIQASRKIGQAA